MSEWNGKGVPPAGTVCEWLFIGEDNWKRVTIVGAGHGEVAVQKENGGLFVTRDFSRLRPRLTDKEKAIRAAVAVSKEEPNFLSLRHYLDRLYDEGLLTTPK